MTNFICAFCIIAMICLVPLTSFGLANTAWIPPTNAYACAKLLNGTTICSKNYHDTLDLSSASGNGTTQTNQVIDQYDTTIGDYTTPSNSYASSPSSSSSITLDTKVSTGGLSSGGTNATQNISITIANHNNRLLVVTDQFIVQNCCDRNNAQLSSVKIGSLSFTRAVNQTGTYSGVDNAATEIWYLVNPPTGAVHITMTPASTTGGYYLIAGAYSIYNTNQVSPIGNTNHTSGATNPTIEEIPTSTTSWLIDSQQQDNTATYNSQSDTVGYETVFGGCCDGASQYRTNPTSGHNTLFYIMSSNANWRTCIVEVKAFTGTNPSSFAIDNNLTTEWKNNNEIRPYIVVDTGTSNIISALAVYPDKSQTNETQVQILTSSDNSTFTIKRTVNISLFANGTWNFVRWDVDSSLERWVKIQGSSGSKDVLSIVEIKVLMPSSTTLLLRHGHEWINQYDGTLPLNK